MYGTCKGTCEVSLEDSHLRKCKEEVGQQHAESVEYDAEVMKSSSLEKEVDEECG